LTTADALVAELIRMATAGSCPLCEISVPEIGEIR
jgi:hypothetical protein